MNRGKIIGSLAFGFLAVVVFVFMSGSTVRADNVVQAYNAKSEIEIGSIVRISSDSSGFVEQNPNNRADLMFGVAVDKDLAPIVIENSNPSTYVSSQGEYSVLVSDENGAIASGDYISISAFLSGIGAKSSADQSLVLGKAISGFDGQTDVVATDGKYKIGKITVNINITKNPSFKNTLAIPGILQKLGNTIAGREVSPLRIYIALVLFVVSSVLSLVLLSVGTKGGLTAIGRNPLSKHSILTALLQVISAAVIIFITSLIGVYLLLRI